MPTDREANALTHLFWRVVGIAMFALGSYQIGGGPGLLMAVGACIFVDACLDRIARNNP